MKNDLTLRADIQKALEWEPIVDPAGIGVAVKDGVVTLLGTVDSLPCRWAVEHAVLRVRGVKAVANELEVRLPSAYERQDEQIARAALAALDADVSVPRGAVRVMVRHGKVVLRGEVDWKYQRDAAVAAVRNLAGVKEIANEILLNVRERPGDLKRRVEEALARSSEIDPGTMTVDLVAGRIVLRGAARTWGEREEAERLAWAAPGVVAVENELVVRLPDVVKA